MKKILALTLAIVVLLSLGTFSVAETTSSSTNEELWSKVDTSDPVVISMYVIATQPVAMQEVLDQVNLKLQAKINTTLELNFISLSDFSTKYPLLLAGGDDVDLVYTSSWAYYKQQVDKGAFYELSEDFLSQYMPVTYQDLPAVAWQQISVNGKIYAVPRSDASLYGLRGVMVRDDIMEKYGFETVSSFADYVELLKAIDAGNEQKDSGMYAFYISPARTLRVYVQQDNNWNLLSDNMYWDADEGTSEDSVFFLYTQDAYKDYCLQTAELAQAGVWPANAVTGTTGTDELFLESKSATKVANYYNDDKVIKEMRSKGIECTFYNVFNDSYYNKPDFYSGDAMAITAFSKNPERAALCLDVIKNDIEINTLLTGGIEGEHYIYNAEDNTHEAGPSAADYPWDSWSWGIRSSLSPKSANLEPCILQAMEENEAARMPDDMWPFYGFYFDNTDVAAEQAVISALVTEYSFSFDCGVFGDQTEAKYEEFVEKLNAAGLDKFVAEYKKQALGLD